MAWVNPWHVSRAVRALNSGGVIAYPTEAVYGLGCNALDPVAVARLLALKGRSAHKGLIVIAASFDPLESLLAPLEEPVAARVFPSWPGPTTWVLPARPTISTWLTGTSGGLAVRITAHPLASALCTAFRGPLVSTSANISGVPAARTAVAARRMFGQGLDYVVPGPVGGARRPSEIRDGLTGRILRPGDP